MTSAHVRDPVSGEVVSFIGEGAEETARLHLELADRYWLTIKEVHRMTRIALFGVYALDDDFDPIAELEKRKRETDRDAAVLSFPLPIEEALAIWQRARDGLRWAAEHHPNPEKRSLLAEVLAEREAAMERLARRARSGGGPSNADL
jgi:hypothetical protein